MSLWPHLDIPRITRRTRFNEKGAGSPDALLVVVPDTANPKSFTSLPEPERWRGLHAQSPVSAGSVRSTVLANDHQTFAVLGYLRPNASAFERLSLAGRMLKEAGRVPLESIALAVLNAPSAGAQVESAGMADALLSATFAHAFALPSFRSKSSTDRKLRSIEIIADEIPEQPYLEAAARGNNLVRWLTALPPNKLDAPTYRKLITDAAREAGLSMQWLDEKALTKLGAGAFLAVSQGNADRLAGIAHLKYRPGKTGKKSAAESPDVALVGKGILFDTGGTNLKPHRAMLDMHIDMSGSAVALATLLALAEMRAPIAADAWLAITENRIGPTAFKPQDVVTASNGVTIQVIHTDAEGRMVLADTLALAGKTKPRLMIDYATLTGTMVYALTERMSGVITNTSSLEPKLLEAGRSSGERVWTFPFDEDYDSDLESKIADVVQCALESKGDHILAARFLSRFVPKETPWVHMDLSSVSRSGGLGHINTDITGFGVRYTLDLLLKQKAHETAGRAS
jgi:leucyl aminopeptidase